MLALIAFQLSWPIQLVAFTVLGFAFFLLHGSIQVQATELSKTARGSATSLHAFFFFMGQASGPVLFGLGLLSIGASYFDRDRRRDHGRARDRVLALLQASEEPI